MNFASDMCVRVRVCVCMCGCVRVCVGQHVCVSVLCVSVSELKFI